jgi:hypothetical protein
MSNPTAMEMMMSRMPPHMRKPEVLKAMFANPDVRARMSALAQEKVRHVLWSKQQQQAWRSSPALAASSPLACLTSDLCCPCAACLRVCCRA